MTRRPLAALRSHLLCVVLTASLAFESSASAQVIGFDPVQLARTVALGLIERASVEERVNHLQSAESLYVRAIDADHSLLDGYIGYARILQRRGQRDRAEASLRSAYPAAVTTENALILWAKSLASMGFVQGALDALAPNSDNPRTLRTMVELCVAAARLPEALAFARRALERCGDDPNAQRSARQLVRALTLLVGEIDPVRFPGRRANTLRRLLAS